MAVTNVLAFVAGAVSVLVLVTLAAAFSGAAVLTAIGARHRTLRAVSGVLTALAGGYVFVYWGQLLFGDTPLIRNILDTGGYWAARGGEVMSTGAAPAVLLAGLLAVVGLAWVIWRVGRAEAAAARNPDR